MVAVAIAGVSVYVWSMVRRAETYRRTARNWENYENELAGAVEAYKGFVYLRVDVPGSPAFPDLTPHIQQFERKAAHAGCMRRKYEHAARCPWLPVAPDPPEPK
jgi:hypothetical protein